MSLSKISKEMQLAALAAILLTLSLVLPWYQKSYFQAGKVVQANVSAFGGGPELQPLGGTSAAASLATCSARACASRTSFSAAS